MGPPAEIHNCLQDCRRADYIPFVCKSHNRERSKIYEFFPQHSCFLSVSVGIIHQLQMQHHQVFNCTAPRDSHQILNHNRLDTNASVCQIADVVLSSTSEARSMFTTSCRDREDDPMALPYCLTEKSLSFDRFL